MIVLIIGWISLVLATLPSKSEADRYADVILTLLGGFLVMAGTAAIARGVW